MGRTSNKLIEAECNQIRRLLEDQQKHWTDDEIMEKLHIKRATYYNRKLKIAEEDTAIWQAQRLQPLTKRANDILKAFEDGYFTAVQIRDSPGAPERDRLEAIKMTIKCKVNIFHLMKGGPTPDFDTIIPVQVSQDDKNVQHKNPALESR